MNRERALLIIALIVGAYLLGYYRVIPAPASLTGGNAAKATAAKPSARQATPVEQPTPYPPPPEYVEGK